MEESDGREGCFGQCMLRVLPHEFKKKSLTCENPRDGEGRGCERERETDRGESLLGECTIPLRNMVNICLYVRDPQGGKSENGKEMGRKRGPAHSTNLNTTLPLSSPVVQSSTHNSSGSSLTTHPYFSTRSFSGSSTPKFHLSQPFLHSENYFPFRSPSKSPRHHHIVPIYPGSSLILYSCLGLTFSLRKSDSNKTICDKGRPCDTKTSAAAVAAASCAEIVMKCSNGRWRITISCLIRVADVWTKIAERDFLIGVAGGL